MIDYDEFYKNVCKVVGRLTHPEAYIIFKECKDNKNKLVMKNLFKLLGGSVWK